MKNLEEAVEELALADDSETIPYLIGEVFICQNVEDTLVSIIHSKVIFDSLDYLIIKERYILSLRCTYL